MAQGTHSFWASAVCLVTYQSQSPRISFGKGAYQTNSWIKFLQVPAFQDFILEWWDREPNDGDMGIWDYSRAQPTPHTCLQASRHLAMAGTCMILREVPGQLLSLLKHNPGDPPISGYHKHRSLILATHRWSYPETSPRHWARCLFSYVCTPQLSALRLTDKGPASHSKWISLKQAGCGRGSPSPGRVWDWSIGSHAVD
jgi:hypothetical protein